MKQKESEMEFKKVRKELWWIGKGLISMIYDYGEKQHYHFFNVSGKWFPVDKERWIHNFKILNRVIHNQD